MSQLQVRWHSSLTIRPDSSEVRRATKWLVKSGADHGIPPSQVERLDLCVQEALANVIFHSGIASNDSVGLRLDVIHRESCHEASVTITDTGCLFDATQAIPRQIPATLAEAEPGGLGLVMMRNNSDALTYSRRGGFNELSIIVRWQNGHSNT